MISLEEKAEMWKKAYRDFPEDIMMRELYFIRYILFALKEKYKEKSYMELSELTRKEINGWQIDNII